ncbi:hypothetical protein GCM10022220_49440 [Actinocatenispora rupis]|uniref:Phosphoribosylformylglycinamidine synthase subunit PurS n=1 Tax=Actinocatenispora rupis TaxID=519421 RepID=A0A8J3NFM9_9ACTN|nr:hypothetical protein Aru02nite_48680 [Actinocatenispora rupis]
MVKASLRCIDRFAVRPLRSVAGRRGTLAALVTGNYRQERRVARVVVDVMLKPEILDPAGQAVAGALPRLGVSDVASVRIGKRVEIEFTGEPDLDRAREIADKLLANPVIEDFSIRVEDTPAPAGARAASGPVDAVAGCDPVEPNVSVQTPAALPADTPLVPAQPEGEPGQ